MSKYLFLLSSIIIVGFVIYDEYQSNSDKNTAPSIQATKEKTDNKKSNVGIEKQVGALKVKTAELPISAPPSKEHIQEKKNKFRMISSKTTTSIATLPALIAVLVYIVFISSGLVLFGKFVKRRLFSKSKKIPDSEQTGE